MVSPTTGTTIFVLAGGALLAAGTMTLGRKWEAQKQAPLWDIGLAMLPGLVTLAYAWWSAGGHRPSPIQVVASGMRGAQRSGM